MGYQDDFLDNKTLPLPTFSPELSGEILRDSNFREEVIVDYEHYSVIMNKTREKRSTVIAALNIDQTLFKQTRRQRKWFIDSRIGAQNQLNNDYYRHNPWDRGHQARRTSAAWGQTQREAQRSSDSTFFYSNATLQHENLNQDEWLQLEDWVKNLGSAKNGRLSVFTGPFYGDASRSLSPSGRPLALIPSGYYKVVCYINVKTNQLEVNAFVIYQDEEALRDKDGARRKNNTMYQATISEIESLTGLDFDSSIYQANPLFFEAANATAAGLNVNTPERYEITRPADIITTSHAPRPPQYITPITDRGIFIAGALINPKGEDDNNEWISLINLSSEPVDLSGWHIEDNGAIRKALDEIVNPSALVLLPGDSVRLSALAPIKLSNDKDWIRLTNAQAQLVDTVQYKKSDFQKGHPLWFIGKRNALR